MEDRMISSVAGLDEAWDSGFERLVRENVSLLTDEEPLTPDADLASLGMDSLNMLGLMVAVEAEYAITIPTDLLVSNTFATPGALWKAVRRLRAN